MTLFRGGRCGFLFLERTLPSMCHSVCYNIIWRGGFEEEPGNLRCALALGETSGWLIRCMLDVSTDRDVNTVRLQPDFLLYASKRKILIGQGQQVKNSSRLPLEKPDETYGKPNLAESFSCQADPYSMCCHFHLTT